MKNMHLRWGADNIEIVESPSIDSLQDTAKSLADGFLPPLPFELTPGLLSQTPNSNAPFSKIYPLPGRYCDVSHRMIFELTGLEFPAAIRVKAQSGVTEDILAIRASPQIVEDSGGQKESYRILFEGYRLSECGELGYRKVIGLGDDVSEVLQRDIDNTWKRVRPRVQSKWNAPVRNVTWPLSADESFLARKPRTFKKSELSYDAVTPKLLNHAFVFLHERGSGSARELQVALGIPEKQAVAFWKGLIADKLFELMPNGAWVLNERTRRDIEKKKPGVLTRKEASALINQLAENAEAINQLPAGQSSLYISRLDVLGAYLDIKQDEFEFLYVSWHAELRKSDRWPYLPDLLDPETGFDAVREMLRPNDNRVRLLEDIDPDKLNCHSATFFKFKVPEEMSV
ncbi:hypothetical protein F6X40_34760 [Paraburkholderia sp. UCT31]|uniref:hypothetical protein n=1 Tax=Paraburkholderia sp. UCT31 TaxID=2615209 RepID=UPI0016562D68|nr:hypothetical protein [Paraburkholderia sp. UCT31]MBC8741724.1 hypothetical protein [Paraburkholderia sp. UCT31]